MNTLPNVGIPPKVIQRSQQQHHIALSPPSLPLHIPIRIRVHAMCSVGFQMRDYDRPFGLEDSSNLCVPSIRFVRSFSSTVTIMSENNHRRWRKRPVISVHGRKLRVYACLGVWVMHGSTEPAAAQPRLFFNPPEPA